MTGGWGTPPHQGGEVLVGEVFVSEKTQDMARALLTACDDLGVDRIAVRTVTNGFIVPEEVWEKAESSRATVEGWAF